MQLSKGQVAVITGAASGIGLALARAAADRGLKLALADLDGPGLDLATADLLAGGADAIAVAGDVRDPDTHTRLRDAALDAFGAIHLVCNNAGVGGGGITWQAPVEMWRFVLDVDLWSVIHGIRTFVPVLLEQRAGHLVNTASAAGLLPVNGLGPYVVAKHGVVALSENLELELAGTGVGVTILCPAFVNTRIHELERHAPAELLAARGEDAHARAEVLRELVEAGLDPGDVARQTLAAVEAGHLYVITHPQVAETMRTRMQRLLDEVADASGDDGSGDGRQL